MFSIEFSIYMHLEQINAGSRARREQEWAVMGDG
jgi:hypothetical protein